METLGGVRPTLLGDLVDALSTAQASTSRVSTRARPGQREVLEHVEGAERRRERHRGLRVDAVVAEVQALQEGVPADAVHAVQLLGEGGAVPEAVVAQVQLHERALVAQEHLRDRRAALAPNLPGPRPSRQPRREKDGERNTLTGDLSKKTHIRSIRNESR